MITFFLNWYAIAHCEALDPTFHGIRSFGKTYCRTGRFSLAQNLKFNGENIATKFDS